jgi:hypothetical protein
VWHLIASRHWTKNTAVKLRLGYRMPQFDLAVAGRFQVRVIVLERIPRNQKKAIESNIYVKWHIEEGIDEIKNLLAFCNDKRQMP